MKLAIFDFDKTITDRDSLIDFIYHTAGPLKFFTGALYLSPLLILHTLGFIGAEKTKETVLNHFFKDCPKEKFTTMASIYAQQHLPAIVRASALQRIGWHQDQGHEIVILSASPEIYLSGWSRQINAELIATRLEFKKGNFSGKLGSPNCKGQEKIRRLEQHYELKKFEYIYAYGDSPSDLVLKSITNEFHYRSFH